MVIIDLESQLQKEKEKTEQSQDQIQTLKKQMAKLKKRIDEQEQQ